MCIWVEWGGSLEDSLGRGITDQERTLDLCVLHIRNTRSMCTAYSGKLQTVLHDMHIL